jgi:transposase-like protein
MVLMFPGKQFWRWQAVDYEKKLLELLIQQRRKMTALRLLCIKNLAIQ